MSDKKCTGEFPNRLLSERKQVATVCYILYKKGEETRCIHFLLFLQDETSYGDLTPLAPHERLPEILVVPREKTPTGAAQEWGPHWSYSSVHSMEADVAHGVVLGLLSFSAVQSLSRV